MAARKEARKSSNIEQWQTLISTTLGRLDTVPISKQRDFSGSLSQQQLGQFSCVDLRSTQLEIVRREKFIHNQSEDFFKVNFHLAGQAELAQNGRFTTLSPGQWVIYDNTRPYTLKFQQTYRQLVLLIPRQQLLAQLPNLEQVLIRPQSFSTPHSQTIYRFLQTSLQAKQLTSNSQLPADGLVRDLLTAALLESAPLTRTQQLSPRATLSRIKQFIHQNLRNPDLSVATIVGACHISKRYLHHLFAMEGITAVNYIWAIRLEQCRLALLNPQKAHLSITDIAFAWGFNSNAHFSRRFKQAFGQSPTILRQNIINSPKLHSQSSTQPQNPL
ncbi:MAG: helix-turn-helix domain-containing protein [Chloroflexota bacterium]